MKTLGMIAVGLLLLSANVYAQKENSDVQGKFKICTIDEHLFSRIKGKSYKEGCTIPLTDLRYLKILHYDFEGKIREGELICHEEISQDLLEIFILLFQNKYPIQRICLIDEFDADDRTSMLANNTSCFNYRPISGSSKLSRHSYGMAIDINPFYNPYIKRTPQDTIIDPPESKEYTDRNLDCPYYIRKGDLIYEAFISRGFRWGGDWKTVKDYQHFEK